VSYLDYTRQRVRKSVFANTEEPQAMFNVGQ